MLCKQVLSSIRDKSWCFVVVSPPLEMSRARSLFNGSALFVRVPVSMEIVSIRGQLQAMSDWSAGRVLVPFSWVWLLVGVLLSKRMPGSEDCVQRVIGHLLSDQNAVDWKTLFLLFSLYFWVKQKKTLVSYKIIKGHKMSRIELLAFLFFFSLPDGDSGRLAFAAVAERRGRPKLRLHVQTPHHR